MTKSLALLAALLFTALASPAFAMCCGGKDGATKEAKKCMPGMEKTAGVPHGSETERGSASETQSKPSASESSQRGSTSSHTVAGKSGCCCCCGKKS